MVVGFGQDIVDAKRIRRVMDRFGERFLDRIFSAGERDYCMRHKRPELHFAARFGAKEAFIKAVGTRRGVSWKDVEVVRKDGPPSIVLHGGAKIIAAKNGVEKIHLSLAHDADIGIAGIILEGKPSDG